MHILRQNNDVPLGRYARARTNYEVEMWVKIFRELIEENKNVKALVLLSIIIDNFLTLDVFKGANINLVNFVKISV